MTQTETQQSTPTELIARAGSYYRRTRYIMAILLIAGGAWFGYDGFVGYPRENQQLREINAQLAEAQKNQDSQRIRELSDQQKNFKRHSGELAHSEMDILIQKVLCFVLPPIGLLLLFWTFFNSRGAYRLTDQTLTVPGHPPVPIDSIRKIDKRKWDRKGIAYLSYELPDGKSGTIKLDDFVYERTPTDAIFARIEQYTTESSAGA
ncbi:MAG: hypothetical protein IT447_12235 [Phycisphaerales bacterium]|jgi:hypothetical protein|nr:hypothetical protein [Phycisphaerales bacterium]